jgi:hypothetical protein
MAACTGSLPFTDFDGTGCILGVKQSAASLARQRRHPEATGRAARAISDLRTRSISAQPVSVKVFREGR